MNIVLYLLALLLIGLAVADWRTTRAGLMSGRAGEGNRLLAFVMARIGVEATLIGKTVLISAFAIWMVTGGAASQLEALVTLLMLDALYAWVVRKNLRILNP
ncbi:hypothetical protein FHW96_002345 [Novosphingobium sp. SG751A]|uniref:DUF5658 family protein n=1 Tax=Novosphingobium sp. SG751A TaxID=2587000 RepID=UPI001553D0A2|nr:DUF5658 family protein [Novosphingobium sp. SG751A]NOW46187.1 hypothetical protein [Novosphingobium sp. SG751A]